MKDNWNLRNRSIKIQTNPHGTIMVHSNPRPDISKEIEWLEEYYYSAENIETLRQKLIEDMNEIIDGNRNIPLKALGKLYFEGIINERFGKDD